MDRERERDTHTHREEGNSENTDTCSDNEIGKTKGRRGEDGHILCFLLIFVMGLKI